MTRSSKADIDGNILTVIHPFEVVLLRMLSLGMTNQEIANESANAVSAIKKRIRQVFVKLGSEPN